jgi:hypothetical protein
MRQMIGRDAGADKRMVPYLGSTSFATYLNAQVVKKNRFRL